MENLLIIEIVVNLIVKNFFNKLFLDFVILVFFEIEK